MLAKKNLADIDPKGKRVLMRVDFNVPIQDGKVMDDTRIQAAMPSINNVLDRGGALILMSHLGRPKGKVDSLFSLSPVADYLKANMEAPVYFAPDCIALETLKMAAALQPGEILLLENTRFHAGEKNNDPGMAQELAKLGELFVNDAFGSAHRAHASTVGVADYLPSVAGLLLEKEIQYLDQVLDNPARPFLAILGGAKIADKISVIENLLSKADMLLIGGGMANTFLLARGIDMADSLVDLESLDIAKKLLDSHPNKLLLPTDVIVADQFAKDARHQAVKIDDIPSGWQALDIGPETVKRFSEEISNSQTVIWNGPMGVFEFPAFAKGTNVLAAALANSPALSIVGGGDSASAIKQAGLTDSITHISTGGGASLAMLAGKKLPGVEALDDKE